MNENDISYLIRKAIFIVYGNLGPGLFESVYRRALVFELKLLGLNVREEVKLPLVYKGISFDVAFKADILVNDLVIIEIKSVEALNETHHKQLITYLKVSGLKLGLLVNFKTADIAQSIYRKVNGL